VPYFTPASRLLMPRCPPQQKKARGDQVRVALRPPPPSPNLPIEVVIEFLNVLDMVVAFH
jgi:hypothetical protein